MAVSGTFLIELQYLPPVEYFAGIIQHETLLIEAHETYQKQTYRNRCYIKGANKVQVMSIPVKKGSQQLKIQEVEINYAENWVREHWRSIQSAYGKAPFFEYYADFFQPIYTENPKFLFEFNLQILTICLQLMNIKREINFTSKFEKKYNNDRITDARSLILPNKRTLESPYFNFFKYQQTFGKEFVDNLSIIDLLFCLGPEAGTSLEQSVNNKKQT